MAPRESLAVRRGTSERDDRVRNARSRFSRVDPCSRCKAVVGELGDADWTLRRGARVSGRSDGQERFGRASVDRQGVRNTAISGRGYQILSTHVLLRRRNERGERGRRPTFSTRPTADATVGGRPTGPGGQTI